MVKAFISHSWKQQFRSAVWAKNLLANIFLGLAALIITSYALAVGIFLEKIVDTILPDSDPIAIVNGAIIYYFFFEFFMRFFLQTTPVLGIQPYLHLPIKKSKMINFMLGKSLVSPFNLLAILFFSPFAFTVIKNTHGSSGAWGWWLFIIGVAFAIHYLVLLFKKKLNDQPNLLLVIIILMSALAGLDYYNLISISGISEALMNSVSEQGLIGLAPFGIAVVLYLANFTFLKNNTYPEDLSTKKKTNRIQGGQFAFLKRFGHRGELITAELKLILRHKRPRSILFLSAALLLYGLIFYTNPTYAETQWIFMFVGVFVTGIFFLNYGQFLLSWDSGFFDFVLIRKSTFRDYISAKYYMFVAAATIAFVLSLGYGYFGWKIVLINLTAFLFNIGINVFVVMRIAMFNPKKIDLNKRAAFNYEGVGAAQFLIVIPILILPYVIYAPLLILGYEDAGLIITALLGLLGFVLREKLLTSLTNYFVKNRHKIAAGFRAQ